GRGADLRDRTCWRSNGSAGTAVNGSRRLREPGTRTIAPGAAAREPLRRQGRRERAPPEDSRPATNSRSRASRRDVYRTGDSTQLSSAGQRRPSLRPRGGEKKETPFS